MTLRFAKLGIGLHAKDVVTTPEPDDIEVGDPISARILGSGDALTDSAQYPDGWVVVVRFKGDLGVQTPDHTKIVVRVTRPVSVNGVYTTEQVDIGCGLPLRKILPNENAKMIVIGTDTDVYFTTLGRIHEGDTVDEVIVTAGAYGVGSNARTLMPANIVNASTLAYEKPVGKFVSRQDCVAEPGSTHYHVEFAGTHWAAKNGKQFDCVKFTATDVTGNSVSATVTSSALSTDITNTNSLGVYSEVWPWDIPLAGLNTRERVRVRAEAIGHVGDATAKLSTAPVADGGDATMAWKAGVGCGIICDLWFFNDKDGTYGTPYAAVDAVNGTSGGVVSLTWATARDAPFQTIAQASAAIQTFNNGSGLTASGRLSRNNADNGRIRLKDNAPHVSFGAALTQTVTNCHLIVEDAPENVGRVTFTSAVGSASNTATKTTTDMMRFRGRIDMVPPDAVAGSQTLLYSGNVNTSTKSILIDTGVVIDGNLAGVMINGFPFLQLFNVDVIDPSGAFFTSFSTNKHSLVLCAGVHATNSSGSDLGVRPINVIGCYFVGYFFNFFLADATREGSDGGLMMSSLFRSRQTNVCGIAITRGFAMDTVICIGDSLTQPIVQINADGNGQSIKAFNPHNCMFIGQRTNWYYNDNDVTADTVKMGVEGLNVIEQCNNKAETFLRNPDATIGTSFRRTGNWRFRYKVDCLPNFYLGADFDDNIAGGPHSGLGERLPVGTTLAQNSNDEAPVEVVRDACFVDNKAGSTNAASYPTVGDYNWKTGGANPGFAAVVTAAQQRNKFDLAGRVRRTDGTGCMGPYERAA